MQAILGALGLSVFVFLVMAVGPAIAVGFLVWRKRRAHARKRSPLTGQLLRSPGQSLREQMDGVEEDIDEALLTLMLLPVALLATWLGWLHFVRTEPSVDLVALYALAGVMVIAYNTRKLIHLAAKRDDLRKGYDAELAVGQELDQLMRQGAHVFHDLPADRFNLDHVVVCTAGVFAIETKGFAKPVRDGKVAANVVYNGAVLQFPGWATSAPIDQAARQGAWLQAQLAPVLEAPIEVVAVVALPGWYVERTGRGPVRVYSGKELRRLLGARNAPPLSAKDVERAVHLMNQRCRTVGALFAA